MRIDGKAEFFSERIISENIKIRSIIMWVTFISKKNFLNKIINYKSNKRKTYENN